MTMSPKDVNQTAKRPRLQDLLNVIKRLRKRKDSSQRQESLQPALTSGSSLSSSEENEEVVAARLGIEVRTTITAVTVPKEVFERLPYAFVKRHSVLPFAQEQDFLLVATADPCNLEPLEELRHLLGSKVKAVYVPRSEILKQIHDCYEKQKRATTQTLAKFSTGSDETRDGDVQIYDLLDDVSEDTPIVKLLNLILSEAIHQGASDIHFEPHEEGLKVRYRIDGVLQYRHSSALDLQSQIITRIKVMAKLDIAERRLPQDGRIKLRMGTREIDFRVSTVPVVNGERVVLRILDKGNVVLGLDNLGMLPEALGSFRKMIDMPEGIVLVTGPTGSGKTTTLYSAVCEMKSSESNIMTVEDPVEYKLQGIAQIGVHPKIGLDFSSGLRHILRQDPDIVMIGEIRDVETAEIAIQASLTGHLVMSTLHTNDAPSAVTRLVDMGIEPYLLSSSLVGVMAQRLVRTICSHCASEYQPSEQELRNLGLQGPASRYRFRAGKGCNACYGSGYRGRHGVYELMRIDHHIQKQIVKSADAIDLRDLALNQGMVTLRQHGAALVAQGVTTVAEVLRVTRGIEVYEEE